MERCIEHYNEILDTIKKTLNVDVDTLKALKDCNQSAKFDKIKAFHKSLDDDKLFLLFSRTKIKVFSAKTTETHNISCSLFNEEITLKHALNNMPDNIKNELWGLFFKLYIEVDKMNGNGNVNRCEVLEASLKLFTNDLSNKVKNDILKVNVNTTTNNMIDDIVGSFQNILNKKANPFDNIMNITSMISEKYQNQLETGEVQLDKIMGGIDGVIPGLMKMGQDKKQKETVIIDESFSTANVEIGKEDEKKNNLSNMMKMIPNMSGLVSMVNRINTAQSDDDLVNIKQDMDNFLEKDLKVDMNQFSQTMSEIEKKLGKNTEATTEATTEPTTEPTTEATTEATTEPTTEPTSEPTIEPTTEATIEPTIEPTTEATIEPTTEPTTE